MLLIVEPETNIDIASKMCDFEQGNLNNKEYFSSSKSKSNSIGENDNIKEQEIKLADVLSNTSEAEKGNNVEKFANIDNTRLDDKEEDLNCDDVSSVKSNQESNALVDNKTDESLESNDRTAEDANSFVSTNSIKEKFVQDEQQDSEDGEPMCENKVIDDASQENSCTNNLIQELNENETTFIKDNQKTDDVILAVQEDNSNGNIKKEDSNEEIFSQKNQQECFVFEDDAGKQQNMKHEKCHEILSKIDEKHLGEKGQDDKERKGQDDREGKVQDDKERKGQDDKERKDQDDKEKNIKNHKSLEIITTENEEKSNINHQDNLISGNETSKQNTRDERCVETDNKKNVDKMEQDDCVIFEEQQNTEDEGCVETDKIGTEKSVDHTDKDDCVILENDESMKDEIHVETIKTENTTDVNDTPISEVIEKLEKDISREELLENDNSNVFLPTEPVKDKRTIDLDCEIDASCDNDTNETIEADLVTKDTEVAKSINSPKIEQNDDKVIDDKEDYKKNIEIIEKDNESHTELVRLEGNSTIDEASTLNRETDSLEDTLTTDSNKDVKDVHSSSTSNIVETMDVDDVTLVEDKNTNSDTESKPRNQHDKNPVETNKTTLCKLNNTMDILSDDDELPTSNVTNDDTKSVIDKQQCISIEDDDDVMLIDEDNDDGKVAISKEIIKTDDVETKGTEDIKEVDNKHTEAVSSNQLDSTNKEQAVDVDSTQPVIDEKIANSDETNSKPPKQPLLPENFVKTCKKNFSEMTREELEEFCILKIVESVVDRSSLGEIKAKLKSISQNLEDYKKKTMMLTKQNRDLQVVLKTIQEEQKRANGPIAPLKITRSVGMQVYMVEPTRRKGQPQIVSNLNKPVRPPLNQNQSPRKPQPTIQQQIPVPRLVPASNNTIKSPSAVPQTNQTNNAGKASPVPNGVRNSPTVTKQPEKRPHSKLQTVDLTDDEPPLKIPPKSNPVPPLRVIPQQNLLGPRAQLNSNVTPRKVYIPISGPQGNIRQGQTIVYKSIAGQRPRAPGVQPAPMVKIPPNQMRMRVHNVRHPAPLPDAAKQYQPPNWKLLPPAPDLNLTKVENGIVISWKIDNYLEENYEEIASYQLYAYQETNSPPNTALWKKIGDVKALPLPMACTLTQFMAGYKYYFAVRAVDVKSRLGPFSVPGSILLLNKM